MENETLLSVGIDIGTTTTHLIISKIAIEVEGGFGTVPHAKISDKKIVYKSPVYFTPLDKRGNIDIDAVAGIINSEYQIAGVSKSDLQSGAVIITGESSKKDNARAVLQKIADASGDFVAAQAGAQLESFLAGKGVGADEFSSQSGKVTANIDIGGGTTNISVFSNGEIIDDCCLNIGGRLIKYENGVEIVSETISNFYSNCKDACDFCVKSADIIYNALIENNDLIDSTLVTNHLLSCGVVPDTVMFSGGVGECIYNMPTDNSFGDIGCMLAECIKNKFESTSLKILTVENPIRATVIGSGNFSMEISGSTIQYSESMTFPLKNLECLHNLNDLSNKPCAFCPSSDKTPSFDFVNSLARDISVAAYGMIENNIPLVVVTKHDCSKALGLCLRQYLPHNYPFICLDGILCRKGDFIDIGSPIANGRAVPVVVKTLVFGG